jgi:hypothetical protein
MSYFEYKDLSQDSDQSYKAVYGCMYWYIVDIGVSYPSMEPTGHS